MRTKTVMSWAFVTAMMSVALRPDTAKAQNPPPNPQPVCYETRIGNKCGNDTVLEWVSCGNAVCNTREIIF